MIIQHLEPDRVVARARGEQDAPGRLPVDLSERPHLEHPFPLVQNERVLDPRHGSRVATEVSHPLQVEADREAYCPRGVGEPLHRAEPGSVHLAINAHERSLVERSAGAGRGGQGVLEIAQKPEHRGIPFAEPGVVAQRERQLALLDLLVRPPNHVGSRRRVGIAQNLGRRERARILRLGGVGVAEPEGGQGTGRGGVVEPQVECREPGLAVLPKPVHVGV